MKLAKILAPIDFSERSKLAAEHASALASYFGSELLFFHAVPCALTEYAGFEGGFYRETPQPLTQEEVAFFKKRIEGLAESAGVEHPFESVVVKGRPAEEITQVAKSMPADILVMPTHGYGPFRRFILGSVTAKVLHDADCPVFTGAHLPEIEPRKAGPYRRVACAVDLSPHSEKTLRWAVDFASAYQAGLIVGYAAPAVTSAVRGAEIVQEWRDVLIESAQESVEKLMQRVGCQGEIRVDAREVTGYIPELVRESAADVLVIGRSAGSGVFGRLRTNAYALIRESPCPVISI